MKLDLPTPESPTNTTLKTRSGVGISTDDVGDSAPDSLWWSWGGDTWRDKWDKQITCITSFWLDAALFQAVSCAMFCATLHCTALLCSAQLSSALLCSAVLCCTVCCIIFFCDSVIYNSRTCYVVVLSHAMLCMLLPHYVTLFCYVLRHVMTSPSYRCSLSLLVVCTNRSSPRGRGTVTVLALPSLLVFILFAWRWKFWRRAHRIFEGCEQQTAIFINFLIQ